ISGGDLYMLAPQETNALVVSAQYDAVSRAKKKSLPDKPKGNWLTSIYTVHTTYIRQPGMKLANDVGSLSSTLQNENVWVGRRRLAAPSCSTIGGLRPTRLGAPLTIDLAGLSSAAEP